MPRSKYTLLYYIGAPALWLLLLTGCNKQTVYNHFEHTSIAGWEKNDTLNFITSPMAQDGRYAEELELRITKTYPFSSLQLIVEQSIEQQKPSEKSGQMRNIMLKSDTLRCILSDSIGMFTGKGISYYQYSFPLPTLQLNQGDRLRITVRHDMKREILPGIADIGLHLTKQ